MAFDFGSMLASAGGSLLNNIFADSRQSDAQNFSAQQFATRYQTTVEDMKKAGLNPMLAYGQGGGNAPTSSAASAGESNMGHVYNQSKLNSAQIANIDADTENKRISSENIAADTAVKRADMYLKMAQEDQAGASAASSRANVGYLEMQSKRISEEIKNIPKEGNRLDALVKNLSEEFKLIQSRTATQDEATKQMRWLAVKTMLESDLTGYDVKAAEDLGNLGRYGKEGKIVIDILRMLKGR